jgi:hypothetical protein
MENLPTMKQHIIRIFIEGATEKVHISNMHVS